jgi:hypothetical protein
MAFDNVTLFEVNIDDLPLGSARSDESAKADEATVEIQEAEPEHETTDEETSGGRGQRVISFGLAVVTLALVARWVANRRGSDDEEFETESVEPGVERVES